MLMQYIPGQTVSTLQRTSIVARIAFERATEAVMLATKASGKCPFGVRWCNSWARSLVARCCKFITNGADRVGLVVADLMIVGLVDIASRCFAANARIDAMRCGY